MAKKKPAPQVAPVILTETILILVPNVWVDGNKFFLHDVMETTKDLADLLVGNKQAKVTKDDVTVALDDEGKRCEV